MSLYFAYTPNVKTRKAELVFSSKTITAIYHPTYRDCLILRINLFLYLIKLVN